MSGVAEATGACEEAATYVAEALPGVGRPAVEVSPTGGAPVVFAEWAASATAPTVLVYSHYDVMPAELSDGWSSPPFDPVAGETSCWPGGSPTTSPRCSCTSGPPRPLSTPSAAFPSTFGSIIEGEEESNSTHLEAWLAANAARLSADVAVVSDTPFFQKGIPAITYGLRGLMLAEIEVEGPPMDLHSGA